MTGRLHFPVVGALCVAAVAGTPVLAQVLPPSGGSPRVYQHHYNTVASTAAVEVVRGADNHVYHLHKDVSGWSADDLTSLTGAPTAAGNPNAFHHNNAHSVVYRASGAAGQIHELYSYGSPHIDPTGPWIAANLSALASAPAAASDPVGYVRADGIPAIVYRGVNNHIYELYLLSDGKWRVGNLTALANAPLATGNPLGSTRFNSVNVVLYRAANGHLYELFLSAGSGGWQKNNLTGLTNAPTSAGDPAMYHRTTGAAIVYRSRDGHVRELFLSEAGGGWMQGDLTALTNAPLAAGNPSGYSRPPRWTEPPYMDYYMPAVVYRGGNGHIYELFLDIDGLWKVGDLTAITNAVAAIRDPIGYPIDDVTASVIYRGVGGRLYRIHMDASIPGTWRDEELFPTAGTP
jgi:hypothetical protein